MVSILLLYIYIYIVVMCIVLVKRVSALGSFNGEELLFPSLNNLS